MRKLQILETQKQILERMIKELNKKTNNNYEIIYEDFTIVIKRDKKILHSFMESYDDKYITTAQQYAYYYLKALVENF